MFHFVAVLVLVRGILCDEISLLVNEDNVKNFKECVDKSAWNAVEYFDIKLHGPDSNMSGLRANNESCLLIPIYLKRNSVLKFVVYTKTVDKNNGITISVKFLNQTLISNNVIRKINCDFEEGWKDIYLTINSSGFGYINLLGYSRDNEMVLVDSVRYTFNNSIDSTDKDFVIDGKHEINIKQNVDNNQKSNKLNYTSNEATSDYARSEDKANKVTYNTNTLGTWTIVLISLGCITVTALITVSAYYLGKFSAKPKIIPVVYDVEPPRVDILPRVTGTVEPSPYNYN